MLRSIQEDDRIKGIKTKHFHFKYHAYTDDIVFFVQNPEENLPRIIDKINKFGQLAGLYINKKKSKILTKKVRKETHTEIEKLTGCEVVNKVKYLGIDISNKNIDLYNNNYEKTWKKIREDMIRWNNQKLSLIGRIAVIKMNVLPRMSYLFQTIPIVKKKENFDKWRKDITNFVWSGRKPRIKYKILVDAKERGGLQLPDLQLYHETCCLVWVREQILLRNKKLLALEGFNKSFGLHAYMLYDKVKADLIFKHHFIRNTLLQT